GCCGRAGSWGWFGGGGFWGGKGDPAGSFFGPRNVHHLGECAIWVLAPPLAGIDLVRLDAEHRLGAADAMQIVALSEEVARCTTSPGAGARRGGAGDLTA